MLWRIIHRTGGSAQFSIFIKTLFSKLKWAEKKFENQKTAELTETNETFW